MSNTTLSYTAQLLLNSLEQPPFYSSHLPSFTQSEKPGLTIIWAPITPELQLISQKIKCQRHVSTQIKAPAKARLSGEGWMMVVVQPRVEADCPRMCRSVTINEIMISLIDFKKVLGRLCINGLMISEAWPVLLIDDKIHSNASQRKAAAIGTK